MWGLHRKQCIAECSRLDCCRSDVSHVRAEGPARARQGGEGGIVA